MQVQDLGLELGFWRSARRRGDALWTAEENRRQEEREEEEEEERETIRALLGQRSSYAGGVLHTHEKSSWKSLWVLGLQFNQTCDFPPKVKQSLKYDNQQRHYTI